MKDMPAVTVNKFGAGTAYYVGTQPDAGYLERLLRDCLDAADIAPAFAVPDGVEVTVRRKGDVTYYFFLNHTDRTQVFPIGGTFAELVGGETVADFMTLPARDVKILKG